MSSKDENQNISLLSDEDMDKPEKLNINIKGGESDRGELIKKESNSVKENSKKVSEPKPEQKKEDNKLEQKPIKEDKKPEPEPKKEEKEPELKKEEPEPKKEEPKPKKEEEQPKKEEKGADQQPKKEEEKASRLTKKKTSKKQKDAIKDPKKEDLKESKKDLNKLQKEDKKDMKGKDELIDKNGKIIVANGMVKEDQNGEQKEGENKKEKKEGEEEDEKEKELETIHEKIKFPIIPYKVTPDYTNTFFSTLKKENRQRPKTLFEPEKFDITRDIDDIMKEENKINKRLEEENKIVEDKEREDKINLNKYKEETLLGKTNIEDPMAVFYGAKKIYIDQFYKLSDLFVICPIYYNYRISLSYDNSPTNKTAYHLFNTKEISPSCSHNCCPNQSREIDINIFNFVLNSRDKRIQKFIKLTKKYRCALSCFCACCSRPTFIVETLIEMLGQIVETRTVTDPILHIKDINEDIIYIIKGSCCQCGFCCRDQCCGSQKCSSCEFTIYDAEGKIEKGKIKKGHRSGHKILPDYDQLEITLPEEDSCQNKILIMCSALVIEYLYFQNYSNMKRCNGKPKFEHAYSD